MAGVYRRFSPLPKRGSPILRCHGHPSPKSRGGALGAPKAPEGPKPAAAEPKPHHELGIAGCAQALLGLEPERRRSPTSMRAVPYLTVFKRKKEKTAQGIQACAVELLESKDGSSWCSLNREVSSLLLVGGISSNGREPGTGSGLGTGSARSRPTTKPGRPLVFSADSAPSTPPPLPEITGPVCVGQDLDQVLKLWPLVLAPCTRFSCFD